MDLIKLCPACGEENPVSEVICRVCMTNLSSVSPTPAGARKEAPPSRPPVPDAGLDSAGETTRAEIPRCRVLTLLRADGRPVPVADGGELGRNGHYAGLFDDVKTVSRRHAKVVCEADQWKIEDLGSTNGTWVNQHRVGRRVELHRGDWLQVGETSFQLR